MKITLINPPWIFKDRLNYLPQTLGIRYLSSFLKYKGHEIKFIDALRMGRNNIIPIISDNQKYKVIGLNEKDLVKLIDSDNDYVGISLPFTFMFPIAKEIYSKLKQSHNIKVIVGGVLPSTDPNLSLSLGDIVIQGEGEIACNKILNGVSLETIKGIHTQNINNGPSEFIEDLNTLPFPYRDDFLFYQNMSTRGRIDKKSASLITSRGCPFNCNFCSTHPTQGYNWRGRNPENVINEITELVEKFKINHIEIEDDNFSIDNQRTKLILEQIIKYQHKGNSISFSTPNGLRIDTLDEELICMMKKANFESIYLALEHGTPEMQRIMNKNLNLDKVEKIAQYASKYDLSILYFYMIGYPGETRDLFIKGLKFCNKLKNIGTCNFTTFLARAYPGTQLHSYCIEKRYILNNPNPIFLGSTYDISTEDFDKNELKYRLKYAKNYLNNNQKLDYIL